MFKQASAGAYQEAEVRRSQIGRALSFGVPFLDQAARGIQRDDLILLGAGSGVGKTQMCCNIALANMSDGRKVHYIALEASEYEIERRMKYPLVMERFYGDPDRPRIAHIEYPEWLMGQSFEELKPYDDSASEFFEKAYRSLFLHYKGERFGLRELIESVSYCSDETDLIIVDHVHYFDFDDDNEARAVREIAKTARTLALEQQRPIILVAHLRKSGKGERFHADLVPGMEEFHGTSELYKVATKVITMAPGRPTQDGGYETFFRIPKMRIDGGVTRFIGKEIFNPRTGGYGGSRYKLGWADQSRKDGFEEIDHSIYPRWAVRPHAESRHRSAVPERSSLPYRD